MREKYTFFLLIFAISLVIISCTKPLGWGILLWAIEDPEVPSGTIIPVYVKSHINQVWVAGVPEIYQRGTSIDKFEIPLYKLELVGSKKATQKRAEEFAEFALMYAETLQDGLPIRSEPDNSARRTYRLRHGEIVKILEEAPGIPPISTTGEPLTGVWYKVLTEDGNIGYCFSYRLRLFEHITGPLIATIYEEETSDPDLDYVLSKIWYTETYNTMINNRRINIEELSQNWRFSPGVDNRVAYIYTSSVNQSFPYTTIRSNGNRSWRFEDSSLQMRLRSDTTLEVTFNEENGAPRTQLFVTLQQDLNSIITQEMTRQETLFRQIYSLGPTFDSANYGTISFRADGTFIWTGYDFLVPGIIPRIEMGNGSINMGLFLSTALSNQYTGALSLKLDGLDETIDFFYTLDSQGMRIEYIPPTSRDGILVSRQSGSPLVIYFFRY